MRFGDYIRDQRRDLQWTQPEAAQQIGIEQSYLSKLESGKSFPSEEVFASIKAAYKIDVDDLSKRLFPGELDQLREIGDVRSAIMKRTKDFEQRVKTWLIAGIVCLMLGGAALGLSLIEEDSVRSEYKYRSVGVILEGEGLDVFDIVYDGPFDNRENAQELRQRQQEMMARLDEQFLSLNENRGVTFTEAVSDGTRSWQFYAADMVRIRSPLRWMIAPAFMLIFGALGCFFASYRWRST
ncbi:MAG: helix-turn-helix transcriptional regulator [Pseudomonadota bacterium]